MIHPAAPGPGNAASVYILASRAEGTLYIGCTTHLHQRMWQHRNGAVAGFTRKYRVTRLVYVEGFRRIDAAVARERQLKGWRRQRKIALIESANPSWTDLAARWFDAPVDPSRGSG